MPSGNLTFSRFWRVWDGGCICNRGVRCGGEAEHGVGQESSISTTVRLDLDDLGGEVCLVDFGEGPATVVPAAQQLQRVFMIEGRVSVTLAPETETIYERVFRKRLVPIEGTPPAPAPPPPRPLDQRPDAALDTRRSDSHGRISAENPSVLCSSGGQACI